MPRKCTVCKHSRRSDIDRALLSGEPYRSIAKQYGTSVTSLHRHKADHIPAALTQAQEAVEVTRAGDLLARVEGLLNTTEEILANNLDRESPQSQQVALGAIREARGCIELLAKVRGQLQEGTKINVTLNPQWVQIRTSILRALAPHPEALAALREALSDN